MSVRKTIRLTIRQHRFGFAMLAVVAVAILASGAFLLWLQLGPYQACRTASLVPNLTEAEVRALTLRCEALALPLQVGTQYTLYVTAFGPPIAALLLAAPLVAVELELGTATLAWSLARNRRSWLLPRMALVVGLTLAVGIAAGLASDAVTGLVFIDRSPWESLYAYSARGAIDAARTLLIAATAIFGGALLGRQMPALIAGVALAALFIMGITVEDQEINRANMVQLPSDPNGSWFSQNDLQLDNRVQVRATGELLTWDQVPQDPQYGTPEYEALYRDAYLGIPASQAAAVVWRNVTLYVVPSLVLLGLTFVVVERRRPYLS